MPNPIAPIVGALGGTGTAILGAGALGALASRSAGRAQAGAAEQAADLQAQAAREAQALQQRIYEESVARQKPFLETGTEFFNRLAALQRGGPEAAQQFLQMDPGYGFRLSEGMKALDRQAAARGGLISGAALKAAQRYGQDVASQEFGNAYNRLASMANVGPQAAGVMSNLGQTYAGNVGNLGLGAAQAIGQGLTSAAQQRGSAYIGGANALTGGIGSYLQYQQNKDLMDYLRNRTPSPVMAPGQP
jgi:hypothetical protein